MMRLMSWMIQTNFLGGLRRWATPLLWKLSPAGMKRHFVSTPRARGGLWGESMLGKAPGPKHSLTGAERVCWAAGLCSNRHLYHLTSGGTHKWQRWHGVQEVKQLVDRCREKTLILNMDETKEMIVGFQKNQLSHALLLANSTAVEVVNSTTSFLSWMRRSCLPPSSGLLFPPPGT